MSANRARMSFEFVDYKKTQMKGLGSTTLFLEVVIINIGLSDSVMAVHSPWLSDLIIT